MGEMVAVAFDELGLAPRYLEIAGRWQDHLMFQSTVEDRQRPRC